MNGKTVEGKCPLKAQCWDHVNTMSCHAISRQGMGGLACEHHVMPCHFSAGNGEAFGTVVLQSVMSKIGTTTNAHHRLKPAINIHDSAKVCLTRSLTASHKALEIQAISAS